jgi:hypothetical protein
MGALDLIFRAIEAGLNLTVEGDVLVVTGPGRVEPLAQALLDRKVEVIAAMALDVVNEFRGWSADAREHYLERLGVADDLGLGISVGSLAEQTAAREARRVAAGLPQSWTDTRGPSVIHAVIRTFEGARFVGYIDASKVAPVWPERPESSGT